MNEEKHFLTKPAVICGLALFACFLWGSAAPCIKTGYRLFQIDADNLGSVLLFAGVRFTLAGILTVAATSLLSHRFLIPRKKNWSLVGKLCMSQTVLQYMFYYVGLANTTASNTAIVQGTNIFMAMLVASLIYKLEKLTGKKILGCLIGTAGILLVAMAGRSEGVQSFSLLGEGFIFFSVIASEFSVAMMKRYSLVEAPYTLSGYQFFLGGLVLTIVGLCLGGQLQGITPVSVLLLVYMAFISAMAYTIWSLLLKYNPVGRVVIFSCATPIFSTIMSVLFLKESGQAPPTVLAVALVLITIGIFIVNRAEQSE